VQLDGSSAKVDLQGGAAWQEVVLFPTDFIDKDDGFLLDWEGIKGLRLAAGEGFDPSPEPPFKLRNLRWVVGTREELNARRKIRLLDATDVDGKTYLDIKSADRFTHGHKAVMNTWLDEKSPLVVEGKAYEHGLTTHAHSEANYFLGGRFGRFHAIALAGAGASVTFEVYADDAKVFDSGILTRGQAAPIDLSLKDVQELKLIVTDGGNTKHGDHGSWVDAHVVRASK